MRFTKEQTYLLNHFFIANFKLKDKIKNNKGKNVKKIYENPKTPYHRLLESDSLTENQKQILIKTFNNLNMVKLRNEIDEPASPPVIGE